MWCGVVRCGVAGRDKEANESLWQVCTGLSRLCDVCVLDVYKCMYVCVCVCQVCVVLSVCVWC